MRTFFTADTHFGHGSVIQYSQRPYRDVSDMDAQLIANWNAVVGPRDVVYHIGDFALCKAPQAIEIAARLNGRKYIVWGNHDKHLRKGAALDAFTKHFTPLEAQTMIKIEDPDAGAAMGGVQRIVLSHYAMLVWDRSHYGVWHLHGHSHGSMPDDPTTRRLDVGVDAWETQCNEIDHVARIITHPIRKLYRPVGYDEVKARMALKTWHPVDGHVER